MRRLQASEEGKVGEMKSALFRAHWMELILWYETVSILSSHE
jgi:hypothetical protein